MFRVLYSSFQVYCPIVKTSKNAKGTDHLFDNQSLLQRKRDSAPGPVTVNIVSVKTSAFSKQKRLQIFRPEGVCILR